MQHPALAQQQFSSERVPTVSKVFPIVEFLLSALEAAKKDDAFNTIHDAIAAGVSNLEKWYQKLDACHVYAVCNGVSNNSNSIIHSPMD
jgi:endonuclease IV